MFPSRFLDPFQLGNQPIFNNFPGFFYVKLVVTKHPFITGRFFLSLPCRKPLPERGFKGFIVSCYCCDYPKAALSEQPATTQRYSGHSLSRIHSNFHTAPLYTVLFQQYTSTLQYLSPRPDPDETAIHLEPGTTSADPKIWISTIILFFSPFDCHGTSRIIL